MSILSQKSVLNILPDTAYTMKLSTRAVTRLTIRRFNPTFVWSTLSMFPSIQTEPFKQLLHLWPEKAIRILYNNYYDGLTYVAQRHTRDIHVAEEIVQYTLAELWLRHREKRLDGSKSVQH